MEAACVQGTASGEAVSWASGLPAGVLRDTGVSGLLVWFRVRNNYELAGSYWEYSSDPAKGSANGNLGSRARGSWACCRCFGNAADEVANEVHGGGLAGNNPILFQAVEPASEAT